jgi:phosphopantothenoylcysteine decarboxylase/phosphopantothenate--cysteine ligase
MLQGKNIVLGVTASISAYKAALLTRLLVKSGASVRIIMTPASREFITPLTLSVLSKNPVLVDFTTSDSGTWNNHVELGLWADLFIIAPASANTLSKMSFGSCDNFLLAVYLSCRCPVYIAPAMDVDMYKHPATRENISKLQSQGVRLLSPGYGELASGLIGEGRMAEPEAILSQLQNDLLQQAPLSGKKALVTAGPTFEAIDPVRFIGNHSTGKMGFAIAEELADNGAEVELICGPTAMQIFNPLIRRVDVTSAEEMYKACLSRFDIMDIAILSAAVADFRPKHPVLSKIKKETGGLPVIELEQTPDILAELGRRKTTGQMLVGFALETDNEIENARNKLIRKNLDFIVLNSLADPGAGFGTQTNKITILDKHNKIVRFELKDKKAAAADIVANIKSLLAASA